MAFIATLSGQFHLSTRKIQRLLREQYQLDFSIGTISEAQGKMIAAMVEPYQAIGKHRRAQDIVHADETRHFRGTQLFCLWAMAVFRIRHRFDAGLIDQQQYVRRMTRLR